MKALRNALAVVLAALCVYGCGKSAEEDAEDIVMHKRGLKSETQKLAQKGVPHLKKLLESKSSRTRMAAISALGEIKDNPEATELLIGMTKSQDPNDAYFALIGLANQHAPQTKELIKEYFKNPNPYLREAACVAIGVYGDKELYPLLDEARNDDNVGVQNTASMIKGKFGIGRRR